MSVAADLQGNKCDKRLQWLIMTGKHVKGRREGRETAKCGCKYKESYEAIKLIYFFLIIISHYAYTPTPS